MVQPGSDPFYIVGRDARNPPDGVIAVADAVVRVFIDHGDRTDRARARLKYLLDDWGRPRFLAAVEERLGRPLERAGDAARPRAATDRFAHLGIHPQRQPGRHWLGVVVPVGRLVILRSIAKAQLVRALSWLTVPALLGPMMGPPLGGLITTYGNWRYIFLINIPMGLLGIFLAWRHIPLLLSEPKPLYVRGFLLSAIGLALTMFGFASLGRHLVSTELAAGCLLAGIAGLALYVLHARRHPHPLIDLGLLQVPTFSVGVIGGSLFRIGVGATPFLLPLMLQLSFGLDPLQSGLITFASAAGAMFMKTLAARILRRFGFRPVLVANALAASLLLCGFGLFRADTPYPLLIGVLLASGCFRSLQFTSLNAITYADIEPERMGQASSLAGMAQQVALAIGVTIGGYALTVASLASGLPMDAAINFTFAFLTVGLVSASSAWMMLRLAPDAGAEMSGKARPGEEVAEPKPLQRPGT